MFMKTCMSLNLHWFSNTSILSMLTITWLPILHQNLNQRQHQHWGLAKVAKHQGAGLQSVGKEQLTPLSVSVRGFQMAGMPSAFRNMWQFKCLNVQMFIRQFRCSDGCRAFCISQHSTPTSIQRHPHRDSNSHWRRKDICNVIFSRLDDIHFWFVTKMDTSNDSRMANDNSETVLRITGASNQFNPTLCSQTQNNLQN